MKKEFSINASYKNSWAVFKSNPFYIIGFFVAIFFASIVIFILLSSLSAGLRSGAWLGQIFSWIVSAWIQIATLTFLLNLFRTKKTRISDQLKKWKVIVFLFLANILTFLILLAGFLLLIVPGIAFAMRLQFVSFYVVDKGANPIEAISGSWNATKGNVIKLFLLSLLNAVVTIAGLLLFIVGLAVTAPLTQMVNTKVYLTLSGENNPLKLV